MSKRAKEYIRDLAVTILVLAIAFGISLFLQRVLEISEHITTLFVFAVFIISILTDGFLFGICATAISVIAINYAFTYPFFHMDFSVKASIFSAIVMLVISLMTSMLTTRLKKWQQIKAETEKERMRANLLRAVSHDLRTPLTTIYGASSSIIESYDRLSDGQKLQMTRGIREDAQWLIRMVENLLSVTKLDGGRLKLIKAPTVLEELIDAVLLKFKKRYPDAPIECELPEELILIPMDVILIDQVLVNLLENAVLHAKGMTRLSLRVTVKGENAVFEVEDDGCGIAKERLESIFTGYSEREAEPFDGQKRNAGIGLSVCEAIIKAHGGSISAENGKNGGAIFRFSLFAGEETSYEQ